ncbi:MAG TPA: glycosyl hydrolase [Chitinophagaceae bacterium]|nr:glycosyl hydrolase [Chitinophagaceae bacterium]
MKKSIVLLLALAGCSLLQAQLPWPAITQTARPWTRWWWQGSAVNKADLAASLTKYRQAGIGGVEITPIYGVKGYEAQFIPYLSPKWTDMLLFTLQEARRLGMGVDMATGTGWPFGGPWVTAADACKNINLQIIPLQGGEQLQTPVQFIQQPLVRTESGIVPAIASLSYPIATNANLQRYAFDQVRFKQKLPLQLLIAYPDKGDPVDITRFADSTGKLHWTAPTGTNWTLYALFQGWHGKMVERAAPGGEGDAIDHFSAVALQHYLARFDKAFKGKDIATLRCFFNDSYEVDDARGQSNWTPGLLQAFAQRRGYGLGSVLPALYQKDSSEKNSRVLYDYRLTIAELLLEQFTKPWHAWARAKGKQVRNQSHGSPANILDLYGAIDIPETEGNELLRFKFATSAAHVLGKPLASSESATWLDEHFQSSLGDVKQAIDKYFAGGVNHIFFHGTNYSPQKETWPGWLFYAAVHFTPANSFWKDFPALNNYIARCQSFLQTGISNNDILFYFPFHDKLSEPGKEMLHHFDGMKGFENSVFKASAEYLLQKGYAFDFFSDKQLQGIKTSGKKLVSVAAEYQVMLVAGAQYLPVESLQQLQQLAYKGATILFYKNIAAGPPGWSMLAEKQAAYQKITRTLQWQTMDGISKAIIGKGQFIMSEDLPALLHAAGTRRESMADSGLQFVRRVNKGDAIYFISNPTDHAVTGKIVLQTGAAAVGIYDPMFSRSGLAKLQRMGSDSVGLFIDLPAGESLVLRGTHTKLQGSLFPFTRKAGAPQLLNTGWKLHFTEGGPTLPADASNISPGSWTEIDSSHTTKIFSGTGLYSIHFGKPAGNYAALQLQLGKVGESAAVAVNGTKIAVLLGPVFSVNIPSALLKQDNILEIQVTNGMANRIADLDKRGQPWKKFYNTNFPAKLPENRGPDGLFTAAQWTPKPSGLMGPVTLTPVIFVE